MGELPIVEELNRIADGWDKFYENSETSKSLRSTGDIITKLVAALERGVQWKGAWREAIVELEDFCSEPVRLRNMIAAADALDDWASESRAVLARARSKGGE